MPLVRRERDIERAAVAKARSLGWLSLKIGSQGWPDRLFVRQGVHVWVEFKRPGEVPTALQTIRGTTLLDHGCHYAIAHSTEELMEALACAVTA